jgi:hypothetical protein
VCVGRGFTNLVEETLLFSTISEWEGKTSHKVIYNDIFPNRLGLFCLFISSNIHYSYDEDVDEVEFVHRRLNFLE